ncbi:MAG: nitrate- and nitrite sensing domain-containing protein [Rhodospirillaceae bacterium]|nr:nitrate- and nitrite sensing domain-containing protein [Rhodospirillaceae bacterium]
MSFFKNAKIQVRIISALLLPVVGFIYFSLTSVIDSRSTATEMDKIVELASLAPPISAVVHELQKERGTSAVYIGSKGAKFSKELPIQHKNTDDFLKKMNDALSSFVPSTNKLKAKISTAQKALGELNKKRNGISSFALTVPQMAGYYTPTIAKMLAIIEEMAVISSDADITKRIAAYTSFLQAKERAGIERAMGGAGFGAGKFATGVYNNFVGLIALQKVLTKSFFDYGTTEQKAFYEKTMVGPDVDEVARMRKIAIASPKTGSTEGIEGPYWFGTITKKINLLKKVEDKISGDLVATAKSAGGAAEATFFSLLVVVVVLLVVTVIMIVVIVRGIVGPVNSMTRVMTKLSEGEKEIEVSGTDRGDEIGTMAQAVQVFKDNLLEMDRMKEEQEMLEKQQEENRRKELLKLADDLEERVGSVVKDVSAVAADIVVATKNIGKGIDVSTSKSLGVAEASERTSSNVSTAASATEELTSSVNEISGQISKSANIARNAVDEAGQTTEKIRELAEAVNKIGEVVALITDIADQTNLLALNATIEAARAGDAGKGFAVVASEVKNLANQTAKATEDISGRIGSIQSATSEAVSAISGISGTIEEINEIVASVAAAIEEQGAATSEIARNISSVNEDAKQVSENVVEVSRSSASSYGTAINMMWRSEDLAGPVESLTKEVESFLATIRNS